jgi:hypothetical protein
VASFGVFGYSANTCEAIVSSFNLRDPKGLLTYADKDSDNLAVSLMRKLPTRANAANIPLTVADDLRAYQKSSAETDMPTDPQFLTAEGLQDAIGHIQELCLMDEATVGAGEIKEPDRVTVSTKVTSLGSWDRSTTPARACVGSDVLIMWTYRPHEEVTDEIRNTEYVTKDEYFMATMRLEGTHFKADSAMVYDLLKTATVNTAANCAEANTRREHVSSVGWMRIPWVSRTSKQHLTTLASLTLSLDS